MNGDWLEQELGSEEMMALGDVIREGTPYTLLTITPHFKGYQVLLDWGYIVCDSDVVESGTKVLKVTPEGRRYYSELSFRKSALEREAQALGSAVSAARFTALAAFVALIDPAQNIIKQILDGFGMNQKSSVIVVASVGAVLLACAAILGCKFYKNDAILK